MATIDTMRVLFGYGTAAAYATELKEPNKLYFCSDTKEIYLGADRYAFGKDITVQISGSGDTIADATWDDSTKVLNLVRGNAGDATSVLSAIQYALLSCVKNVSASNDSAILVDNSDKDNIDVSLKIAEGALAGNVQLSQGYHGLRANVDIPEVPVQGVASGEKIISLTNEQLSSTLTITTERGLDNKQYIILKGINGVEVSKFDASDFVTAGMLQSVTLEDLPVGVGEYHKFLVMTFLTEGGGTETVRVDLEDLIDVYTAASGGGLTLNTVTNEFSITNTVEPNTLGVNEGQNITFGSNVVLNTITYDSHGSITGTRAITFGIPALTGGSIGVSGAVNRVITYATIDGNGRLTGEAASVVNSTAGVDSNSTDSQVPTAKAVYNLVDSSMAKWNRF